MKIDPNKMRAQTTSCNPAVPGSVAAHPQEVLGSTAPHQHTVGRVGRTVLHVLPANALAGARGVSPTAV